MNRSFKNCGKNVSQYCTINHGKEQSAKQAVNLRVGLISFRAVPCKLELPLSHYPVSFTKTFPKSKVPDNFIKGAYVESESLRAWVFITDRTQVRIKATTHLECSYRELV